MSTLTSEKIHSFVLENKFNINSATELLISLIEASDDKNIRVNCIELMGSIANKSINLFNTLENYLISDESPLVRAAAAKVIIRNFLIKGFNSLSWTIQHGNSSVVLKSMLDNFKDSSNKYTKILRNKLLKKVISLYGVVQNEALFLLDLDVQVSFFNIDYFRMYLSNFVKGVISNNYMMCSIKNGHIKALNLNNWGISKVPESIGYLSKLKYLILSNNKIKELPASIGLLNQLKTLDLGNCQIISLPDSLRELKMLKKLSIDRNFELKSLPEPILLIAKNIISEKYVHEGVVQYEAFILSLLEILCGRKIEKANFNDNFLNREKAWHYKLNENGQVVGIYIFNKNKPQFSILPEQICNLKFLKELYIPNQALKSIPNSMGELKSLRKLNLRNNKLDKIPKCIKKLNKLIDLKLAGNRIKEISDWIKPILNKYDLDRGLDEPKKRFFGIPFIDGDTKIFTSYFKQT